MNQIEFLLRLAENARDEGDQLTQEQDRTFSEHAKKLLELSRMIEAAKRNVDLELERFRRWIPQDEQAKLARRPQPEQQQAAQLRTLGKPVNG